MKKETSIDKHTASRQPDSPHVYGPVMSLLHDLMALYKPDNNAFYNGFDRRCQLELTQQILVMFGIDGEALEECAAITAVDKELLHDVINLKTRYVHRPPKRRSRKSDEYANRTSCPPEGYAAIINGVRALTRIYRRSDKRVFDLFDIRERQRQLQLIQELLSLFGIDRTVVKEYAASHLNETYPMDDGLLRDLIATGMLSGTK